MAIQKKDLMAKARGFTVSIEKMSSDQRIARPNGGYGEDYNKLQILTAKMYPSLQELLPPLVNLYTGAGGINRFTRESFSEIDTYCEQIFQLLSEQD